MGAGIAYTEAFRGGVALVNGLNRWVVVFLIIFVLLFLLAPAGSQPHQR